MAMLLDLDSKGNIVSTAQITPELSTADQLLREAVAVPEFARKLSADYGYTVSGAEEFNQLRQFSDVLDQTVDGFLTKVAADQRAAQDQLVKSAIDTAYAVAGVKAKPVRPAASLITDYLQIPGVKEAAAMVMESQVKAAEATCASGSMMPPAASLPDDDDEDALKKKKVPAVV